MPLTPRDLVHKLCGHDTQSANSLLRIMQTAIRNFFLAAGFLAVAIIYYWKNWSAELPILGEDHAIYLLTADHMSP
jgi:hypothetical protein